MLKHKAFKGFPTYLSSIRCFGISIFSSDLSVQLSYTFKASVPHRYTFSCSGAWDRTLRVVDPISPPSETGMGLGVQPQRVPGAKPLVGDRSEASRNFLQFRVFWNAFWQYENSKRVILEIQERASKDFYLKDSHLSVTQNSQQWVRQCTGI